MRNLAISLALGALAFFGTLAAFTWYAAILPGLLVGLGAYVWLAQQSMKKVQAISEKAQKEMQVQRKDALDKALETFKSGLPLAKEQFLVGPVLHSNIGMLLYLKGKDDEAQVHLEQGYSRNFLAVAMLGCLFFRKGDLARAVKEFETAVKYGKKESLTWAVYAYVLTKAGKDTEAMKVLGRAVEANPSDEKLKALQLSLQNGKRLKMRAFEPAIFQFRLDPPPPELTGGRRVVWQRR